MADPHPVCTCQQKLDTEVLKLVSEKWLADTNVEGLYRKTATP